MTAALADDVSNLRDGRYSLRHVQASLGLSRAVIDGLVDAGFVTPDRGPRNQMRFSFQDLMLLRTAHELREAKVAPRRIVEALAKLRAVLPEGAALSGVRISALGSRVIVRDREGTRDAASGQYVIDFESGSADASPITSANALTGAVAVRRLGQPAGAAANDEPARAPRRHAIAAPHLRAVPDSPAAVADAISDDAIGAFTRGEALEDGDPRSAEAAYRSALAIDATHLQAAINLSALLCDQGRAGEADAVCIAMLAHGVDHPLLRFNHALALDDLRRPRAALAAYEKALALDAGFADAHYNAACLLESLRDTRGALRHFNAYRKLQGL